MKNSVLPFIILFIILLLLKLNAQTVSDSVLGEINVDLITTNKEDPDTLTKTVEPLVASDETARALMNAVEKQKNRNDSIKAELLRNNSKEETMIILLKN